MKSLSIAFLLFLIVGNSKAETSADPNFFPITVWWQGANDAATFKAAGVNTYVLPTTVSSTDFAKYKAAGMKVICAQDAYMLSQVKDPTIYAWMPPMDEPDNASATYNNSCTPISDVMDAYNKMKAADPTHPVYLNLGMGVSYLNWVGRGGCRNEWWMYADTIIGRESDKNGYLKACDIVSYDIYPMNSKYTQELNATAGTDVIQGNLYYVPKGIDSLYSWQKLKKRPVWTWIESTKFSSSPAPSRKPTTTEVKAEVWMALIHEAKGVGYFAHVISPTFDSRALLKDAAMMSAITAINKQITSLAPVLNSTSLVGFASNVSANGAVPVDIMSKYYQGANYVFAVPMRDGSTTVEFTTTSSAISVEVIGENRTIPMVGGKFTDSFSAYQVHLYKLNAPTGVSVEKVNLPSIFPNPIENTATLDMANENNFPYSLTITDLQGCIVKTLEINQANTIIHRDNLLTGMYFFLVKDKQNKLVVTQKISIK